MANFDKNRFRTVNQQWETPDDLFNHLNKEFKFEIDLAGDKHNTKCKKYYSLQDNALKQEWDKICWLNPPYGSNGFKLKDWVKKAHEESQSHGTIVMLIPARTNTNWWHDYCMKAKEIRFIKGRPKFKGCIHGLPQPLAIVVFENNSGRTILKSLDINKLTV